MSKCIQIQFGVTVPVGSGTENKTAQINENCMRRKIIIN